MLKLLLKFKILCFLFIVFFSLNTALYAEDENTDENFYPDKTRLVTQQIDLLKTRLTRAEVELQTLQKQQKREDLTVLTPDRVNKQLLDEVGLNIAIAKSNLDSINIELTESQQDVIRLEKDVQEIQNQLNIFNIFGLKIARNGTPDLEHLRNELDNQTALLQWEKTRVTYLLKLQSYAESVLQLYKSRHARVESILKSQTILLLKEQQAQTELGFEQQQSVWLQRLNNLKLQLNESHGKNLDKIAYEKLQNEIFYVNENVNLTYLQMLIARYQDQIQQLRISIAHGSSITLFNKATDQAQLLAKQLSRLNLLLTERLQILTKRKNYFAQLQQTTDKTQTDFNNLDAQYQTAITKVATLNKNLIAFRAMLDHELQQELSARQGLPGLGTKAWLEVGGELLLVPTLAFQVFKSLSYSVLKGVLNVSLWGWALLLVLEVIWSAIFVFFNIFLKKIVVRVPDHEFGHINLKWLFIKLLHRNLIDIALVGNFFWLLSFLGVPSQNFTILINLAFVWFFFKAIILIARLCLVETAHDRAGHDVRLYHQLKWIFLTGGIITALTVFMHQLPVIYEVKDLFIRVFLLFLLIASIFLLKQWQLVPGLILPHIDNRRTYLKRVIVLLGLLIPLVLLINSLIGLLGFVNLVLTISWYESIFILVLVGYLLLRGLLIDSMEWISKILIRHVTNGWLWTEAFLKPIDRVLHIVLFLSAWAVLFLFYGWDRQSPVVERLNKLLHYRLADVLNTTITPMSIIELAIVISLLYWAARWTREFMYRMLLSHTKDLGLRNSLAILSQYAMILIGVFISLRLLGIDFRALAFVATAFAFGVGLGLRDLVNNFACGFLLLLERPLRVGDIISINGFEGDVTHIGGRAVTVRTWDHMEVIVPNAEIFSKSFTNWTAKDNIVRTVLTIKTNRHDNPHEIQTIIHRVLDHQKNVLVDPAPEVFMTELADGQIEFEVRYYVNLRQIKSRYSLRSEVLIAIWDAFEKHGIQPPYPHHEIHLKGSGLMTAGN
ncbi:MAG TPA: mechanosensitive ion channel domain-containing protein [Gammaproteobacteria bacterium]|nr:mechanosensitive ion channel domain-containing protein [Gammaproteobacteria bacterium]